MAAAPALAVATPRDTAHVDAVVRGAGTSFFWAMRLLPSERRRAMFAVYAFCREVDDVADRDAAAETKRSELEAWRREIASLYAGAPSRPTSRALRVAIDRFELARDDFLAVIDGMATDADGPVVAPTRAELELYCDRVAGAVGRLCVRVFGAGTPEGRAVADHLGQALQLTNILRDLDEDAASGRLYLPAELLDAHGIQVREPEAVVHHPAIDAVCRDMAGWAEAAFGEAERAMTRCPPRSMRPARMMMRVYRCTLANMRARGWQPPRLACGPGKVRKLAIAFSTLAGFGR